MFTKKTIMPVLALSLSLSPVQVMAGNDFLPGLIIGGIIGAGIANENNRNRGTHRGTTPRTGIPRTQEAREIQAALNFFGFPAGAVDGQIGRKSRAAISSYQAYMGFPVSGYLTDFEKDFLLTSHQRAALGGPVVSQVLATSSEGNRALLLYYRDELSGATTAAAPAPAPEPMPEPEPEPTNGLPTFFGTQGGPSLAAYCNNVNLNVSANGGYATAASMSPPDTVLGEQLCLARTYAIARGDNLIGTVQGVTPQQIQVQCESFGPTMREYVASLSLKPAETVIDDVSSFLLSTGMAPDALADTARICLSVGYRTDNNDVALGSALLLTALGERPYGELMGHHLDLGFGVSQRTDLALNWYNMALDAVDGGAPAVFGSGDPARTSLIRNAAYAMSNGGTAPLGSAPQPTTALPVFTTGQ